MMNFTLHYYALCIILYNNALKSIIVIIRYQMLIIAVFQYIMLYHVRLYCTIYETLLYFIA